MRTGPSVRPPPHRAPTPGASRWACALLGILLSGAAYASPPKGPLALPGWPRVLDNGIHSAVGVGDVDGDGRFELAVGLRDGQVLVLDANGETMHGWPQSTANAATFTPLLLDLDGDGCDEVAAGSRDGRLHLWNGKGERWAGWPAELGSAAVAGPVSVDGEAIAIATADGRVHLLDPSGRPWPGWPQRAGPRPRTHYDQSCTATLDLDGDGRAEILHLGGDPAVLQAWNREAEPMPGLPSPLEGPGVGLAIDAHPCRVVVSSARTLLLWEPDSGRSWRYRLEAPDDRFSSPPTVISLPDGTVAVAAGTRQGWLHLWRAGEGPMEGWPHRLAGFIYGIPAPEERFPIYAAPAVLDVDGDEASEIVVGGFDQHLYAFRMDGSMVAGWPLMLGDAITARVTTADLDGDGREELIVGQQGETLYAYRLSSTAVPPGTRPRFLRRALPGEEWPLRYCVVATALLGMLVLLLRRIREERHNRTVTTRSRRQPQSALVLLFGLVLLLRLVLFGVQLHQYRQAGQELDRTRPVVERVIDRESERLRARLASVGEALRREGLRDSTDPQRLLYELEHQADRARLDYEHHGLAIVDRQGRVRQAVGLARGWQSLPERGGETESPLIRLGSRVAFAHWDTLGAGGGDVVLLTSLAHRLPERLAATTGSAVHLRLDGRTIAFGSALPASPPSSQPWLGVVQPAREIVFETPEGLEILLAQEGFDSSPLAWLDLAILLVLPVLFFLGIGDPTRQPSVPLRWGAVGIFLLLWTVGWFAFSEGHLAQRPVPLGGHVLEFLLHLTGLVGMAVAFRLALRAEAGRRLSVALLVSYLLVALVPLALVVTMTARSVQEAQRRLAREILHDLEERADHLLLAYLGNHSFEGDLRRAGQRLRDEPTERGWFDFVGNEQFLFTYDLPTAYLTLWAQERARPERIFTGYSWRAPRHHKFFGPRPDWLGEEPQRGLFLEGGHPVVRASRLFRGVEAEALIVSHIPLDEMRLRELERRLRILPFLPPVRLEPAWMEPLDIVRESRGLPLPLSTRLVLPARDWTMGGERQLVYRARAWLPLGEELWTILPVLALFTVLPLGLSIWGATVAYRRTVRPMARLLTGIRKVEKGDLEFRMRDVGESEIALTARAFDRMVESLKHTVRELAEKQKVEEVSELKSRFISMVSHDLKTPLSSIKGAAENVLGELAGPLTPRQRLYLEMILESSERLQAMISDLLDLSRLESGHVRLETETLDLRREIEGAVHALQTLLEPKELRVELSEARAGARVRADRARLWQILNNLLSNAVRFSPPGGRIGLHLEPIQGEAPAWSVLVTDEGPGIPAEARARVFEPFYARPSGAATGGAGLGLAIVRQLVEMQGGSVDLVDGPGPGGRLRFVLPAAGTDRA